MITFSLYNCIVAFSVTICSFIWIRNVQSIEKKLLYLLVAIFYFVFCGITSFLFESEKYILFYTIYTISLGGTLYYTRNVSFRIQFIRDVNFINYVDRVSKYYLILYFSFLLFGLVYPENKLLNLIILKAPDGNGALEESLTHSIWDSFTILFGVFFFVALSTYRDKPKKVVLLMFLNMYINYAQSSYISRGGILRLLVVVFLFLYINYPQKRKILLFSAFISSFFLIIFFIGYMYLRMGGEFAVVDMSFALEKIAEIELSFSQNFDQVLYYDNHEFLRYMWWFISLPLPGFLKFGTADLLTNLEYTENILGLSVFNDNFFVTLPGLAIEGVYVFGSSLFFLHAILFALVLNLFINTLMKSPIFYIYCLYSIINIPFVAIRGGTLGLYSISNKLMPIIIFLLFVLSKSIYHKKRV